MRVPVCDTHGRRLWMRTGAGRVVQSRAVTVVPRLPLPSYALNGLSVALGIGLVHAVFAAVGGAPAVAAAGAGAICASLGDLPDTQGRNTRRVFGAALAGVLTGLIVTALETHREW